MLFQFGNSIINSAAQRVLGKIAAVVNDHNDLQVIVKGHTDDMPIPNSRIAGQLGFERETGHFCRA